jgi:microcompartment protein CcmK/EutM
MKLAIVLGNVVATQRDASFEGSTLLVLQPVDAALRPTGGPIVATDSQSRRGVGEVVHYVTSGDAVYTGVGGRAMPTDAAIMGIANQIALADDAC